MRTSLLIVIYVGLVSTTVTSVMAQKGTEKAKKNQTNNTAAVVKQQSSKQADDAFTSRDYELALSEYLQLLSAEPKNATFNYRVAICYLNTNIDKLKAQEFLDLAIAAGYTDSLLDIHTAQSLAYHLRFDEAIDVYKIIAERWSGKRSIDIVQQAIEACEHGKELIKNPVAVVFENLGPAVNSPFADYGAYISENEQFLMFNSTRPDNSTKKTIGDFYSNVYISSVKDGKWQNAQDIGDQVNTEQGSEEIVGVCANGETLIFSLSQNEGKGDVFVGPKMDNQVLKPFRINANINSTEFDENSASITPDGKTIYFASNRPGGYGGYDIYRAAILPNGEWGEAYNLGLGVNTVYDDDFPTVSLDGKTLYFSSKGHNSMGGFDLFKSELLDDQINFGAATNMGYPLNTPFDDKVICMSAKGRYGYTAALRADGLGDLDIYRVTFSDVDQELTVIKGVVNTGADNKIPANAFIEVFDAKTNNPVGQYKVNGSTGKYALVLPPGKYFIELRAKGYKLYNEQINILDKASYIPSIEKNITILPE